MRVLTLLCAVMSVSGCPSVLQSTPSALCRATVDCPAAQICDLSDRQYGVCVPSCGNSTVEPRFDGAVSARRHADPILSIAEVTNLRRRAIDGRAT